MSDGVDTGSGHIDPNADSAKTDLVAVFHFFRGEGCFNSTDVGQVDATGGVDDGAVASKPERFIGKVAWESDGLRVVENAGSRIEDAHVARRARCTWNPGTDSF
ncbi:hypothetical protein D3C85_1555510 [compost metagenome]